MEEKPEPPPDIGPPPEKTAPSSPLPVPLSSPEISRQSLLRQQAARLRKGKSVSPSFLGRRLRNSSNRSRQPLATIPEARIIRQKLSFGPIEEVASTGKPDGRRKRKGSNKSRGATAVSPDTLTKICSVSEDEINQMGDKEMTGVETERELVGDGTSISSSEIGTEMVVVGSEMMVVGDDSVVDGQTVVSGLGQEEQGQELVAYVQTTENGLVSGTPAQKGVAVVPDGERQKGGSNVDGVLPRLDKKSDGVPSLQGSDQAVTRSGGEALEVQHGMLALADGEMLDMLASQPLQGRGVVTMPESARSQEVEMAICLEDHNQRRNNEKGNTDHHFENGLEADFPPLGLGRTKSLTANFERGGKQTNSGVIPTEKQATFRKENKGAGGQSGGSSAGRHFESRVVRERAPNAWGGFGSSNVTAAQRIAGSNVSQRSKNAVPFEPEKIKDIGFSGTSQGIPSIYFSKSDNDFLAERLGHAVVGKFSH